ncbi:MAG TPA: hypothetical protein PLP27_10950 [Crocinitomicaceae bacterium]|nr:hypothetical protein [Crocinitomicaceae bacterium]
MKIDQRQLLTSILAGFIVAVMGFYIKRGLEQMYNKNKDNANA